MWIITKDLISEGADNNRKSQDYNEKLDSTLKHKFKMFDDDGYLYYEGLSDDSESEKAFYPLDDFGMPNAGCTEIRYLHKGKYETL